jgi:hypothetical protein
MSFSKKKKSFPPNFIFPPVAQAGGEEAGRGIGGEEGKNFFFFYCFFQRLFTFTVPVAIRVYFESIASLLRNHPTVLVG